MSSEDDAFDSIINGPECASEKEIQIVEQLAVELVADEPIATLKKYKYEDSISGVSVEFSTEFDEEVQVDNTFATITVYEYDDVKFYLCFNPSNEVATSTYPLDVEPADIINLVTTLLDSDGTPIDTRTVAILKHVNSLLRIHLDEISDTKNPNVIDQPLTEAVHVADLIRNTVNSTTGDKAVQEQSYSTVIDSNSTLTIYFRKLLGFTEEDRDQFYAPILEIAIEDRVQNISHIFTKNIDGDYQYELLRNDEPDIYEGNDEDHNDLYEDIILEFVSELNTDRVTPQSAKLCLDTLIEAKMQEIEPFCVPEHQELTLGLLEDRFFDENGFSPVLAAAEVLRAIDNAIIPSLDTSTENQTYRFNTNKRKRLLKFIQTKISTAEHSQPVQRNDLYDIHIVCQNIMDEAAETNHPISQAIALLGTKYRDILNEVQIQQISTELVIQTHESRLRELFNQRITARRIGSVLTQGDTAQQYLSKL